MAAPTCIWRQALLLGTSLALGLGIGWSTAGASALAAPLAIGGGAIALGLAWWSGRRWTRSVSIMESHLADWQSRLETAELTAETIPELDSLRDALRRTQQALRTARSNRDQRIADLQRDTRLLQSVLGTMVEAVLVVDGGSRLIYLNPAARRLLELGERVDSGRLLHEVFRSPGLHALIEHVLQTGVEQLLELELVRNERIVTVSAGPLPLEPRPGAVLVLHDVTELRRLERMRRDFASNVSHELKTPLTSIQAYADALLDGALDDSTVNRGFVERIVEQSERLRRLILDLLNLARVESQEQAPDLETFDLNAVVRDDLPSHRSVADSRELTLREELCLQALPVRADREGLRTVLDNLVRNALSYTPSGGIVTVRTLRTDDGALLEVADTGVGIPREHQQRIFERFFRVDKARSREVGGTGLGLAIVKHLAEQWGAAIEVESDLGRGSLFRIRWRNARDNGR